MKWIVLLLAIGWPCLAVAHFNENTKPRTFLIAPAEDGLTVFVRAPVPLFFARDIVSAQEAQIRFEAEFLATTRVGNAIAFSLSVEAIDKAPEPFANRLNSAFVWQQGTDTLQAKVLRWAIHADRPELPFTTVTEATSAISASPVTKNPTFGKAYIDVAYQLPHARVSDPLQFRSTHPSLPLPGGVAIDNHIRDLRFKKPLSITAPGQLEDGITLHGSPLRAALRFIWQGIIHILIGADHVLLVVCIALGVGSARQLALRVSAFTLGHAVTLAIATLGYVPAAPWFIPSVETAIALTVLYTALAAWRHWPEALTVLFAIGLLHGLGFAFVLDDMLDADRVTLVNALAAFTLGIEVGQLAILTATIAISVGLARVSNRAETRARYLMLLAVAATATYWTVSRAIGTLEAVVV